MKATARTRARSSGPVRARVGVRLTVTVRVRLGLGFGSCEASDHGEAAVLELGEEGHLTLARGLRVLVRGIGLGLG